MTAQQSWHFPETVESVVPSRTNGPLIHAAATLWIKPEDEVLDLTYGRGKFWTHYRPARLTTNDLNPDLETDYSYDFRDLSELEPESFDVIVFDPPYISPGGRETSTIEDFNDRYGLGFTPATSGELQLLIAEGIHEAEQLLRHNGRLFVKCMDYQEGSTYWTMRHWVVERARKNGLRQVDEFVHYSGTGPQPSGRKQWVSRRAHSFLCIFRKS